MFDTILVPLDGSKQSALSLPVATDLAQKYGATIVLANVVEPAGTPGWEITSVTDPNMISTVLHEEERQGRASIVRGRRYLASVQKQLEEDGIRAISHVMVGRPAKALLQLIPKENVDLVVMTTRGMGGIKRAVLGSVADELVRSQEAPVLLITVEHAKNLAVSASDARRAKAARRKK